MASNVKLSNGIEMPMEGFGVFQVTDPDVCEQTVLDAIETGYRLIDTASSYQNEEAVGRAIQKSEVPRGELFITTKAYIQQMGYDKTMQAFEESLQKFGTGLSGFISDPYALWRLLRFLESHGRII
ncbi:MAG: aldo/keto reductase [[Clostridium] scindens]